MDDYIPPCIYCLHKQPHAIHQSNNLLLRNGVSHRIVHIWSDKPFDIYALERFIAGVQGIGRDES